MLMTKAIIDEQTLTLNQALLAAMDSYADTTCFGVKQKGSHQNHYQNISYRHFQTLVFHMTNFFRTQDLQLGERVAIIAGNSLEWAVTYMACLFAGGVVVPLRTALPPETLHFILKDSGACLVVMDDAEQFEAVKNAGETLANLRAALVIGGLEDSVAGVISISTILAEASTTSNEYLPLETQDAIRRDAESVQPEALASIDYTTDEMGQPIGAVFDQAQRLQVMRHLAKWLIFDEDDLAFTILPWDAGSSLDFTLHQFLSGIGNSLAENRQSILENSQQTSPTVMLMTPFIFENFYRDVMQEINELPESSQEVFHWALAISKEYLTAGSDASSELREGYARADMTFFNQIRGKIGGRVRRLYSTMASLPQHLTEFFEAIGLLPLNIYSLAEAGGFPTISLPNARRYGSCGRAAPDFQIRIADDGELLVKGATVMGGYWQRPKETGYKLDADGWLHTGDLGYCDEEGYIYLTGRKEALAVLSTGRKIMPAYIEKMLMASPFIDQAVVFGEGRPYVSALLVPDLEALAEDFQEGTNGDESATINPVSETLKWYWLPENQEDELLATTAHPEVKILLDNVVNQVNSRLGHWEQIKIYSLLEQAFSPAADELNEVMPAGRPGITQKYQAQVEAMYPQTLHLYEKEITEVQVSPERLRALLAKENILDAWMVDAGIEFLFRLARTKQIDAPSMVHICDIAASIAQMEHEGRPLSTALIVGDPARIAHYLPPGEIQLLGHDHIRRMRKMLFALAPVVDGQVLGFIIDKHGYVRGIHKLTGILPEQPATFLLGPQFRRHAAISGECDAVVFFVPSGGKQARVFADGELVGRYSNGDWSPESIFKVGAVMAKLVEQKNYDLTLVQRVLRCAFRMSEENLGAIFIIGNSDFILDRSDAPEISHFALIVSADLDTLSDEELINFAKQDGATMIDTAGQFRGCMVFLRPGADTPAEIGPGKGARHSSAAKISAEAQCLAITVSQDGPISIYADGKRLLSL